jgi:NADH:ubiquinone oxidoreductase subunit C
MTHEEFIAMATAEFPEVQGGPNKQYPELIVPADKLHAVAVWLKDDPKTKMDYLFNETAADRKDGFHVVYHITSTTLNHSVMVKVILTDKANPLIASVYDVWRAAEFYEREIFDLFGIRFENHPDLRRIFLEEDWVGYPLRKDYKDSFIIER